MFRKGDEPVPGYRLEQFLGKGQFGEVWRTTAPGGTAAALKFIDLGGKQGIKEFRGVRRVKEIRHANLMPITALWMLDGEGNILGDKALDTYDAEPRNAQATLQVGDEEGSARPEWLVVAMLLGRRNLADRLEECRAAGHTGIPVEELLRYMEEAAKGIDYLNHAHHDLGEGCVAVQHCDIKPANIMLIGDAAVVCDFGLARVLSDVAATATGMVGSPAYMAPECIGRKPGPASDQYSLAVSYVELRTGHLPFKEISYLTVLEANRSGNLELSRLSPAEQQVIRKATSIKPEDRYSSSLAMVRALRQAVEGQPSGVSLPGWAWAAAAVAILILLPGLAWLGVNALRGGAKDETRTATLVFLPADVQVKLNGEVKATEAGRLALALRPGERATLEATHPDGYAPLRRQLTWETLSADQLELQLERNAQWHADEAARLVAAGNESEALAEYKSAVRLDPAFESPAATQLRQHENAVRRLAAVAGGKQFASAADDGRVSLWTFNEAAAEPNAIVLSGLSADQLTESLAASPDGKWLIAGGQDDRVLVWNLASPETSPLALTGHQEDVTVVRVLPDSQSIVSASFDKTLRWWRFTDGRFSSDPLVLSGHAAEVLDVRATSDRHWLVSLASDNRLLRWDLTAAKPAETVQSLPEIEPRVRVMAIAPRDNRLIAGRDDGQLSLLQLDAPTNWQDFPATRDAIETLAIDPSGAFVYFGDASGELRKAALAATSIAEATAVYQHAAPVVSLAISPDGEFAATGSWDKSVAFWRRDAEGTLSPLKLVSDHGPVHQVIFTADGQWLVAACDDGTVLVWNVPLCALIQRAVEKPTSAKSGVEA